MVSKLRLLTNYIYKENKETIAENMLYSLLYSLLVEKQM